MSTLLHVDYLVRDMERSLRFYTEHFGCSVVEDAIIEGEIVAFFSRGEATSARIVMLQFPGVEGADAGAMLELVELRPRGAVDIRFGSSAEWVPSLTNMTVLVEDLETFLDKLRAAAVEIASPVFVMSLPRLGPGRIAFVRDPDDNLIELAESGISELI